MGVRPVSSSFGPLGLGAANGEGALNPHSASKLDLGIGLQPCLWTHVEALLFKALLRNSCLLNMSKGLWMTFVDISFIYSMHIGVDPFRLLFHSSTFR